MTDAEYSISQSAISDISFKELILDAKENMSNSEKIFSSLLPANFEIKIYSTAVFRFDTGNLDKPPLIDKKPKYGEIYYTKHGNESRIVVTLGKMTIPLSAIDEELLAERLKLTYSIETGKDLDNLPRRTLCCDEKALQKETNKRPIKSR